MPEIDKHEIRSPEMQDVMTEIPGKFLRWGLLVFFGILASILGVSWFISYPDVITAPITLTTWNPPVMLVAGKGGKIERMFAANGSRLAENQPVALIAGQPEWEEVCRLSTIIDSFTGPDSFVISLTIHTQPELGELQDNWIRFHSALKEYQHFSSSDYYRNKIGLMRKQINRQEEYVAELKRQMKLSEEDLQLTVNSYRRDSTLFTNSNYSISITEYERSRQAMLQKKVSFSGLQSSIKNTEASILQLRESLLDLENQSVQESIQRKNEVIVSFGLLKNAVADWKERHLIESPVAGTLSYTTFWKENQVINAGEVLAAVIPDNPEKILIRAYVPVSGAGKVKEGQLVNISLAGYPDAEYGFIRGSISGMSLVPVKDSYIAGIEPVNGMLTTYNRELKFINDMTGTAEIITEESRLIYRLIKPLNKLAIR